MPIVGKSLNIVSASGKIYDITHVDSNEHNVTLPAGYPQNTRAMFVSGRRVAGTGFFELRSVSGADGHLIQAVAAARGVGAVWFRASDGLFYYRLTTGNDDWDIYIHGYWTN